MLVVDSSWTGPEMFPRFIDPELKRTWPSPRYGIGAETSGRLLRLVNARVIVDMMNPVRCLRWRDLLFCCGWERT